jgi:hypothetical protein
MGLLVMTYPDPIEIPEGGYEKQVVEADRYSGGRHGGLETIRRPCLCTDLIEGYIEKAHTHVAPRAHVVLRINSQIDCSLMDVMGMHNRWQGMGPVAGEGRIR